MNSQAIVVDTNTFVAAGFNPRSGSARIVEAVRDGRLRLIWTEATRAETERVVVKIPPLNWQQFARLFAHENQYTGETNPAAFSHVPDKTDRKFAALAAASGAILITQDAHLLESRERADVPIVTPGEFLRQHDLSC